jgi:4-hydroxybenzoate polyprenyltransferase
MPHPPLPTTDVPLVVDLDGTLLKTDLLVETASCFVTRHPARSLSLVGWLRRGRPQLKARLANAVALDVASLPYHEPLLAWLRREHAGGRRIVLATASHRLLAEQVARHLGLFDAVLATDGDLNLKAARKRDLLVSRYGDKGFDYVGNDAADLAVWPAARLAHVVSDSRSLVARARAIADIGQVLPSDRPPAWKALGRAMRPHQWLKNVLIFVPLLASHGYGQPGLLLNALLAFIAFGLTASGVYLGNDLIDIADDRHHPRKRHRPFAAGDASLLHGWLLAPLLVVAAFTLSATLLAPAFTATLAIYLGLTLAYSLRLKQVALLDVMLLAGLYTLRIVAGTTALQLPLSFWLLSFSVFIFCSLAFVKRFSELEEARQDGREGPLRGRGYHPGDLEIVSSCGSAAGYIAVLVLALYIQDPHTAELYRSPKFIWLACPLLLYWISRTWLIAHRGQMHDDPIVFALTDRISWAIGACIVGVFALATLVS